MEVGFLKKKRKGRGWSNRNFSVAVQLRRSNIHTTGSYSEPSVKTAMHTNTSSSRHGTGFESSTVVSN